MGRLFGTDGIRGIANRDLSIRRAEEVGMALAEVIRGEHPEKRPTVVIGRDTRLSGEMLQAALAGGMPITPQVLLNVAADRDMKEALHESPEMEALIEECEERLGDTGRILIRASGTEPLIRVMVEGEDAALIRELAERLAAGCEKLLK